jgi:molybdopterin-binding protein
MDGLVSPGVPTVAGGRSQTAAPTSPGSLSLAENVCLALIVEGISHGWAIGTLLAPGAELGRIWSLTRALSYRAIDGLVEKGLVDRRGKATGQGRDRTLLAPSANGKRASRRWLDSPVEHVRDVRTELLMKLVLRERSGLENTSLLVAQRDLFEPVVESLSAPPSGASLVDLWRRENVRAVRRFLDEAIEPLEVAGAGRTEIRLSARNQLRGRVISIYHGEVTSVIKAVLGDGQTVTSVITRDAVSDLDLATGDVVLMIVKSTEVMVAKIAM